MWSQSFTPPRSRCHRISSIRRALSRCPGIFRLLVTAGSTAIERSLLKREMSLRYPQNTFATPARARRASGALFCWKLSRWREAFNNRTVEGWDTVQGGKMEGLEGSASDRSRTTIVVSLHIFMRACVCMLHALVYVHQIKMRTRTYIGIRTYEYDKCVRV